jgi:hypothetical protein
MAKKVMSKREMLKCNQKSYLGQPTPPFLMRDPGVGEGLMTSIGFVVMGLMVSSLAIDIGGYYAVNKQLQNATDAGALAGAIDLPLGEEEAEATATDYALDNMVNGDSLKSSDLSFESDGLTFKVTGRTVFRPVIGKLLCGGLLPEFLDENGEMTGAASVCAVQVQTTSAAKPAARDTMLVIDKSSSMRDLGNMRPLRDVQSAAKKYIDMIADFNNEQVDRIGLATFNQTASLDIGLTSQDQSSGFESVKGKVDNIVLFGCRNTNCSQTNSSDSGWNTNYQVGLKKAIDELAANGRPNAEKIIIFMTDGLPNLPAPSNYYTSSSDKAPYNRCITPVNNATEVKETFCNFTTVGGKRNYSNCRLRTAPYSHSVTPAQRVANTWYTANLSSGQEGICTMEVRYSSGGANGQVNGKRFSNCKTLPHSIIPDNLIAKYQNNERANCGVNYTDYMTSQIEEQADRAAELGITIHTIEIRDDDYQNDNAWSVLRRLIYDPDWDPGSLDYMASVTDGQQYVSPNYDAAAIEDNYAEIAQDIHVVLTSP